MTNINIFEQERQRYHDCSNSSFFKRKKGPANDINETKIDVNQLNVYLYTYKITLIPFICDFLKHFFNP